MNILSIIMDKCKVMEIINDMYTFINIDRDLNNKVTIKEVFEMLDEIKVRINNEI